MTSPRHTRLGQGTPLVDGLLLAVPDIEPEDRHLPDRGAPRPEHGDQRIADGRGPHPHLPCRPRPGRIASPTAASSRGPTCGPAPPSPQPGSSTARPPPTATTPLPPTTPTPAWQPPTCTAAPPSPSGSSASSTDLDHGLRLLTGPASRDSPAFPQPGARHRRGPTPQIARTRQRGDALLRASGMRHHVEFQKDLELGGRRAPHRVAGRPAPLPPERPGAARSSPWPIQRPAHVRHPDRAQGRSPIRRAGGCTCTP